MLENEDIPVVIKFDSTTTIDDATNIAKELDAPIEQTKFLRYIRGEFKTVKKPAYIVNFASSYDPTFLKLLKIVRGMAYRKLEFEGQGEIVSELFYNSKISLPEIKPILSKNFDKEDWVVSDTKSWPRFRLKCMEMLPPKKLKKLHRLLLRKKLRIFMMMPFADELKGMYLEYIQNPLESRGHDVKRADEYKRSDLIREDIFRAIAEYDVLIADLTGKNANVFYEIGYAHAKERRPILICQKQEELPFDTHGFRTIFYDPTSEGYQKLTQELLEYIKPWEPKI